MTTDVERERRDLHRELAAINRREAEITARLAELRALEKPPEVRAAERSLS
jgi:hypothetical protein